MIDETRPRRLTLFDAMTLLAATAVGLAGSRAYLMHIQSYYENLGFRDLSAEAKIQSVAPSLLALSLALPVLGLWPGTSVPFRRAAKQPGVAALLAVAFCFGVQLLEAAHFPVARVLAWSYFFAVLVSGVAKSAGLVVGALWFAMALGRRWPTRADWVELGARFLGACWIALYIAVKFR